MNPFIHPFQSVTVGGRWYVLCLITGRWSREQPSRYVHLVASNCNWHYHEGAHY